eukprot:6962271-Prymnesium_polylepis.2
MPSSPALAPLLPTWARERRAIAPHRRQGPRAKLNQSTPIRSLVDFARVAVPAGGETRASFSFSPADLATVDTHGRKVVVGGEHQLTFSRGAANLVDDSKFVVAVKPPTASA